MTRMVTATEAKARLLALLDDAAAGDEIEITKHGRTVARLVPATGSRPSKGNLSGFARTAGAADTLYSTGEEWDAS